MPRNDPNRQRKDRIARGGYRREGDRDAAQRRAREEQERRRREEEARRRRGGR